MIDKPTAAIGHIPFPNHRTCEHLIKRPLPHVPEPTSGYAERPPRNRWIDTLKGIDMDELGAALNRAQGR